MVRWPSGKARVCKTLIRGFDSHPHLIFLPNFLLFVVTRSVAYLRAPREFLQYFSLTRS